MDEYADMFVEEKVKVVIKWRTPTSVHDLQSSIDWHRSTADSSEISAL